MREIVFRGKSKEELTLGEWIYGYLFNIEGEKAWIWNGIPQEVLTDTVGQYTGLKDRNGKEIWEGDIIVQQGYSGIRPMLVKFEAGAFVTGEHNGSSTPRCPMLIQRRCVIVGNRWDNPELLEPAA